MKIFDQAAPIRKKPPGAIDQLLGRLRISRERPDISASAVLANNLEKMLDNRYVLLRNIRIRKMKAAIPAILVGPTGLWVIYPSDVTGIFRANEGVWEQLRQRGQEYVQARPNPLHLASVTAAAVEKHLQENQVHFPRVEPVIFFTHPGLHVDATRPDVKIVMPDTLDRFVASFVQAEVVLDRESVRKITRTLGEQAERGEEDVIEEVRDAFSFQELASAKSSRRSPFSNLPKDEPYLTRKVPFTRLQWFLLVLLIFINIVILTTLVVVVLIAG